MNNADGRRRWLFAEVAALRWVAEQKRMAFPTSAATKPKRIRKGDQAVLYTSRGAFHNPTRDEARLVGLAAATGDCEPVDGGGDRRARVHLGVSDHRRFTAAGASPRSSAIRLGGPTVSQPAR